MARKFRIEDREGDNQLELMKLELDNLKNEYPFKTGILERLLELKNKIFRQEERNEEILRLQTGVEWREKGERSSKLFKRMAQIRQKSSHMTTLVTEHGDLSDQISLQDYIHQSYQDIHRRRPVDIPAADRLLSDLPRVSEEHRHMLAGDITVAELRKALKGSVDSAPGLDGLPYSLYAVLQNELLPLVVDSWNYSIQVGSLPYSQ